MSVHRIIPRSEWGARFGTGWGTRPLPATEAWLHRPAMYGSPGVGSTFDQDAAHVRRIEDVGRARFRGDDFKDGREVWPLPLGSGISYTYVISRSGRIFAGHDPVRQSSHTKGHNDVGVGIALADGPSATSPATRQQVEACAWLLRRLVTDRVLTRPRLDGGHLDTGFPTSCPTAAHAAIPTINALAAGDSPVTPPPTMPGLQPFPAANRISTDGFWRDLEALFDQAGYAVYCGPSYVRRGWCAPGKHPHGRNSRHFVARALDLGHDPASGAPVSPWEGAVLDATSRMLRARYPRMGMVWNRGPGDHQDHLHADDQHYGTEGRPTGHVVPGLTLFGQIGADVGTLQTNLRRAGHQITADGIFGLGTYDALRIFQHVNGLAPDGMCGDATRAALPTYRLQAAINAYGWALLVDGVDGPATQSAARQAATLAGWTGDLHDHARLATHLEDTMSILTDLPRKILDQPFPASALSRQTFGDGPHTLASVLDHTWRRAQGAWTYAHAAQQRAGQARDLARAAGDRLAGLETAVRELAEHTPGVDADDVARQIAERVGEYTLTMRRIDEAPDEPLED